MKIRSAHSDDQDAMGDVYRSAFPEGENELVSKLAVDLLSAESSPQTLALVAEDHGVVVGHVAFSPVEIENHQKVSAYILAPLAVRADCQKRCVGKSLVEFGLQRLSDLGVKVVFVYGDPNYYGRFGFSAEHASYYKAPYPLEYAFGWQAVQLGDYDLATQPVAIRCVPALMNPTLW